MVHPKSRFPAICLLALAACGDDDPVDATVTPLPRPALAVATASANIVFEGDTVTLDGRTSTGGGGVTSFTWTQTEGPSVSLVEPNQAVTTFTAPSVNGDAAVELRLEILDGAGQRDEATVALLVVDTNVAPRATVAASQIVGGGAAVTLDGSAATDPDGTITSYAWAQTSGPTAALTNASTAVATFTAPIVTSRKVLEFRYTVRDNSSRSASAVTRVFVEPVAKSLRVVAGSLAPVLRRNTLFGIDVEILNASGQRIIDNDASELEVEVAATLGTGELAGTTRRRAAFGVATFDDLRYSIAEEAQLTFTTPTPGVSAGVQALTIQWPSKLPGLIESNGLVEVLAAVWLPTSGAPDLVLAGRFESSLDFELDGTGTPVSAANSDGFVARYASDGAVVWSHVFGGAGDDAVTSLAVSSSGDLVLAASFEGNVNFGTPGSPVTPPSFGNLDAAVARLAATTGELVWVTSFGGNGNDTPSALALGTDGDPVVGGTFEGTVDFDSGVANTATTSAGGTDAFVVRLARTVLDAAGLTPPTSSPLRWLHASGGSTDEALTALTPHGASEVYVGTQSDGGAAAHLHRLGSGDGVLAWTRSWTSTDDENRVAALAQRGADLLVVLESAGNVDLDPGAPTRAYSTSAVDIALLTISSAGALNEALTLGGSGDDRCRALQTNPAAEAGWLLAVDTHNGSDLDPHASVKAVAVPGGGEGAALIWLTSALQARKLQAWGQSGATVGSRALATAAHDASARVVVIGTMGGAASLDVDPNATEVPLASTAASSAFVVVLDDRGVIAP